MGDEPSNSTSQPSETKSQTAESDNEIRNNSQNETCGRPIINIKQTAPHSVGIQKEPHQKGRDSHDRIVLIFIIIGVIFAGAAAGFTWWQADIAKETGQAQVRAYVFVKPYRWVNGVETGKTFNTTVVIRNGGQSPASDLALYFNVEVRKSDPKNSTRAFSGTTKQDFESVLDPSTEVSGVGLIESDTVLSADEFDEMAVEEGAKFYVWGVADYRDVFESLHHSYFCFIYFGREKSDDGGMGARFRQSCPHPNPD